MTPATMRAVSLRSGELALREIPIPTPGPGQLLVRTLACAICASDHHYMDHPEVALADRSGTPAAAVAGSSAGAEAPVRQPTAEADPEPAPAEPARGD